MSQRRIKEENIMRRFIETWARLFPILLLVVALGALPAVAAQETFLYDDMGRLISVTNDSGESVEYIYDKAGNLVQEIRNGSRDMAVVCASLAHPMKDHFPDRDVYLFQGQAGEMVTVGVMADPPEDGMGLKIALTLKNRTPCQSQIVSDISVLPNEVSMILEQDGIYEIEVHGQKKMFFNQRYSGPYCLTLEAKPCTVASLTGPAFP